MTRYDARVDERYTRYHRRYRMGQVEDYQGQQYVGVDLHRRRSVVVRMSDAGELLEVAKVDNSWLAFQEVLARAGEDPQVVLEATYGWYWAADALAEAGASVHLAHPLGVKGFEYRRVKNDLRDAVDLADLLRMERLPLAWIAPPAVRELRELVRHRAKLVAMRSRCKNQVHAVLAKNGVQVPFSDLFGVGGSRMLDELDLPKPYLARIDSLRRVMDLLVFEIDVAARLVHGHLTRDPGYRAVQTIPGIGPVLGAVFVAEIGDITRFPNAGALTCWAGLTPRHRESDTTVRRGSITKQGSRLIRWAAIESVKRLPPSTRIGAFRDRVAAGRKPNIAAVAAARRQLEYVFYALRDHHITTDLRTPQTRHNPRSPAAAGDPIDLTHTIDVTDVADTAVA